jgi:glycolate oxidase
MLGVVTEITLRLLPLPPDARHAICCLRHGSASGRSSAGDFAAGFLPSSLELADHFTLEAARRDLGKGFVPEGNAHLLVDLDGQEESVRSEPQRFANCLRKENETPSRWRPVKQTAKGSGHLRREFSNSLRATGLTKLNEDVVVPRSRLVDLMEFAEKLQTKHGFPIACLATPVTATFMSISWRTVTIATPPCEKKWIAPSMIYSNRCWHGDGVITGEHGIGLAKNAGGRKRPAR